MPRKPNYGLNKHRKEQDRKAKKDAKRLERQQRRDEQRPDDALSSDADAAGPDSTAHLPPDTE